MNEYKCKCNKIFDNIASLRAHKSNCKIYQQYFTELKDKILTKEFLEEMINKRYSILYIANEILKDFPEIKNTTIIKQAKKINVKMLSIKEISKSSQTREKFKKTCLKRYGAENVLSYGTMPFQKKNETIKDKYKVENVFQSEEIKIKIKKTLKKRYGVNHPIYIPGRQKNVGNRSMQHKTIEQWLLENNINFKSEKILKDLLIYNENLKRNYGPRPDILIPELNLIIEIYGDIWHANPNIYKDDDLIVTWTGEKTAKEIREKNRLRENHINNCGYKIFVLWSSDIKKNTSTKIKEKLIKEIKQWEKILKLQKLKKLNPKFDTIYL